MKKGAIRVSASRLQEFANILDVPVSFFFEGLSSNGAKRKNSPEDLAQQLLATRDGHRVNKGIHSRSTTRRCATRSSTWSRGLQSEAGLEFKGACQSPTRQSTAPPGAPPISASIAARRRGSNLDGSLLT